ncbi:MAG TPA: sigma-70 family RNA polymerase sigma factor [Actinomycetota bacterium]|nr:sigma-70 family RNA polymerase sigma factor [Actinomycetota bacterium]
MAEQVQTTAPSETDGQLVERVRAGDGRAFDRLVRRHLRVAHAVARSKLSGNEDDADDVCQEAFMTALERIEDCRDPARFRPWLLSIVRNKAHNYRAYLAVREAEPLDVVEPAAGTDDVGARVERHELKDDLAQALAELTELQRTVFVRFDLEGWGHGEIAEALGVSRGASRFHLHAARRALRKRLSAHRLAWSR